MSYGVGRRHGLDPALMQLWHRSAAIALIQPLPWKPPYAALKSKKKKDTGNNCSLMKYKLNLEAPVEAQWLTNPHSIHEDAGSIPGLAQWVKDPALL